MTAKRDYCAQKVPVPVVCYFPKIKREEKNKRKVSGEVKGQDALPVELYSQL